MNLRLVCFASLLAAFCVGAACAGNPFGASDGGSCQNSGDCQSGNCDKVPGADTGTCAPRPNDSSGSGHACYADGANCGTNTDCCSQYCGGGTCAPNPALCAPGATVTIACTDQSSAADCCGAQCLPVTPYDPYRDPRRRCAYHCKKAPQPCSANHDCCSEVCLDGHCDDHCAATSEPCTVDQDCCSFLCEGGACAEKTNAQCHHDAGASSFGLPCGNDPDCCGEFCVDGNCSDAAPANRPCGPHTHCANGPCSAMHVCP